MRLATLAGQCVVMLGCVRIMAAHGMGMLDILVVVAGVAITAGLAVWRGQ